MHIYPEPLIYVLKELINQVLITLIMAARFHLELVT